MGFLQGLFDEMTAKSRYKNQMRYEQGLCETGKHDIPGHELEPFMGRYRVCRRSQCNYSYENPDFDQAKIDRWVFRERTKDAVRKAAGAVVCAATKHDIEYAPSPDSWSFCRRCGEDWGPWKK